MKRMLNKELRLATPLLTYLFLAFSLMTLIPGYPILCGAFFVCFGIFQAFQYGREANDILYTVLLPIGKGSAVKAKYLVVCFFELTAFLLMAVLTCVRMLLLSHTAVYAQNVLMAANPLFLAFVLLIFAAFNLVFLRGFFQTAYGIGKPFLLFVIAAFVLIGLGETLHHLPGLAFLNTSAGEGLKWQLLILLAAAVLYGAVTALSYASSRKAFEKLDL